MTCYPLAGVIASAITGQLGFTEPLDAPFEVSEMRIANLLYQGVDQNRVSEMRVATIMVDSPEQNRLSEMRFAAIMVDSPEQNRISGIRSAAFMKPTV